MKRHDKKIKRSNNIENLIIKQISKLIRLLVVVANGYVKLTVPLDTN